MIFQTAKRCTGRSRQWRKLTGISWIFVLCLFFLLPFLSSHPLMDIYVQNFANPPNSCSRTPSHRSKSCGDIQQSFRWSSCTLGIPWSWITFLEDQHQCQHISQDGHPACNSSSIPSNTLHKCLSSASSLPAEWFPRGTFDQDNA